MRNVQSVVLDVASASWLVMRNVKKNPSFLLRIKFPSKNFQTRPIGIPLWVSTTIIQARKVVGMNADTLLHTKYNDEGTPFINHLLQSSITRVKWSIDININLEVNG